MNQRFVIKKSRKERDFFIQRQKYKRTDGNSGLRDQFVTARLRDQDCGIGWIFFDFLT